MLQYVSNNATQSLKGIRITDSTGVANVYIDTAYNHLHYTKDNKDFFLINNIDMDGGTYWRSPTDVLMIGDKLCCSDFTFSNTITQLIRINVSIDSATYNDMVTIPYVGNIYRHSMQYDINMLVHNYQYDNTFYIKNSVQARITGGANGETVSKTLPKGNYQTTYRNNVVFEWTTTSSISSKPDLRPTGFAFKIGDTWVSLDRLSGGWNSGLNITGGYYIFGLNANSSKWGIEVDS